LKSGQARREQSQAILTQAQYRLRSQFHQTARIGYTYGGWRLADWALNLQGCPGSALDEAVYPETDQRNASGERSCADTD
jgi:hypothetical protein